MVPPTDEAKTDVAGSNGLLSREALLARTVRAEEEVDVPGLGRMLVGEINADERAAIIEKQAGDYQNKRVDVRSYQKSLLVAGLLDPASSASARLPLLSAADGDAVMKVGSAKIAALVDAIERLSGMGAAAVARAEGNSDGIPSVSSISS